MTSFRDLRRRGNHFIFGLDRDPDSLVVAEAAPAKLGSQLAGRNFDDLPFDRHLFQRCEHSFHAMIKAGRSSDAKCRQPWQMPSVGVGAGDDRHDISAG